MKDHDFTKIEQHLNAALQCDSFLEYHMDRADRIYKETKNKAASFADWFITHDENMIALRSLSEALEEFESTYRDLSMFYHGDCSTARREYMDDEKRTHAIQANSNPLKLIDIFIRNHRQFIILYDSFLDAERAVDTCIATHT